MDTLISSCTSTGDTETAFPFFRDQETKNAVNALLILSTTPVDTARDRVAHRADDEDDETIDAESLSEQDEENRTHTALESDGSVYAGSGDFEIRTIHTEDPSESVGKLV